MNHRLPLPRGRLALAVGLFVAPVACGLSDLPGDNQGASGFLTLSGVTLQTVLQGRFVGAASNGGGAVNAVATVAQGWETFSLEDINGGDLVSGDSVFIHAGNGQLFQAVNGGGSTLNAASNNRLGWETFKVVKANGGGAINNGDVIGLQAFSGSWLSAQDGGAGPVFAYGGALGSWEQLRIGGLSALPPSMPGQPLPPTPAPPGGDGTVVKDVSFRTAISGNFVGAVNNGGGAVTATATAAQAWETFSLVDLNKGSLQTGDSVFVRTSNGQFFHATNGGGSTLTADSTSAQAAETFHLVKASGGGAIKTGDVVGLQTSDGHWVSAENGGGGAVFAYGAALGPWERLLVGVGAPAPGPVAPPSPPSSPGGGGSGFASILSEGAFNAMFPGRNGFYTYAGLVNAAATMGAFANTGDITARKREVAAFLANVGHETGDLIFIEEIQKADYCSNSGSCPCQPGKRYFGRGPLQLSWNFNYCAAGAALGVDLRGNPDLVAQDPTIAWRTAIWFWMTSTGAGNRTCHDAIVSGAGFGETIRTINGALECNGNSPGGVGSRVGRYQRFCGQLGVDPGGNQGC